MLIHNILNCLNLGDKKMDNTYLCGTMAISCLFATSSYNPYVIFYELIIYHDLTYVQIPIINYEDYNYE